MKFTLRKPCQNCPFRTDIPGYLSKERAREITNLERTTFQCHQTVDYDNSHDEETGEPIAGKYGREKNAQHCAGALIMLEHMEQPSQMMRIMERLGLYDQRKLNMKAPVFKSAKAFIKAQKG